MLEDSLFVEGHDMTGARTVRQDGVWMHQIVPPIDIIHMRQELLI